MRLRGPTSHRMATKNDPGIPPGVAGGVKDASANRTVRSRSSPLRGTFGSSWRRSHAAVPTLKRPLTIRTAMIVCAASMPTAATVCAAELMKS